MGIVYWLLLDLIQGLYPVEVRFETVERTFLAIGLFGSACLIGTMKRPWPVPMAVRSLAEQNPSPQNLFKAVLIAFVLGMFYFVYSCGFSPAVMLDSLLVSRFAAPWSRGATGGWEAIPEHLTYFGYLVPTLTVILRLAINRWSDRRLLTGLLVSGVMVAFLAQGGGRRIVAVVLGSALLTWFLGQGERIRLRYVVGLAISVCLLLLVANIMLGHRSSGFAEMPVQPVTFDKIWVDDNFLRLAQIIEAVPAEHPYTGFEWLIYVLIRPIPRALWPGKPEHAGFSLSEFYDYKGVSLTSSVIGEWYFSFGWGGVVIGGFLLGALARTWVQLLEPPFGPMKAGVYAVGLMVLFVSLRSLVELILMTYPLGAWLILHRFCMRRPRRTFSRA
jgi:oligosaccharide repeat unit polymerase